MPAREDGRVDARATMAGLSDSTLRNHKTREHTAWCTLVVILHVHGLSLSLASY